MEIATRTSSALSLRASSGINLTRERTTGLSLHGSRYDFTVEAIPSKGHYSFELRAIDRKSGRWSSIATVNQVMSELLGDGRDLCDACWWYTPWDVSAEECASLMTSARTLQYVRAATIFGTSLHLLIDANISNDRVEHDLEAFGITDVTVAEIAPTLEDVFVQLTETRGKEVEEARATMAGARE